MSVSTNTNNHLEQPLILENPIPPPSNKSCCRAAVTTLVLSLLALMTAAAGAYLIITGIGVNAYSTIIPGAILAAGGFIFQIWAIVIACKARRHSNTQETPPEVTSPSLEETKEPVSMDPSPVVIIQELPKEIDFSTLAPDEILRHLEEEKYPLNKAIEILGNLTQDTLRGCVQSVQSTYFPIPNEGEVSSPLSEGKQKILLALAKSPDKLKGAIPEQMTKEFACALLDQFDSAIDANLELQSLLKACGLAIGLDEKAQGYFACYPRLFALLFDAAQPQQGVRTIWKNVLKKMNKEQQTAFSSSITTKDALERMSGLLITEETQSLHENHIMFIAIHPKELVSVYNKHKQACSKHLSSILPKMEESHLKEFLTQLADDIDRKTVFELFFRSLQATAPIPKVFASFVSLWANLFNEKVDWMSANRWNQLFEAMEGKGQENFIRIIQGEAESKEEEGMNSEKTQPKNRLSRLKTTFTSFKKVLEVETNFHRFLLLRYQFLFSKKTSDISYSMLLTKDLIFKECCAIDQFASYIAYLLKNTNSCDFEFLIEMLKLYYAYNSLEEKSEIICENMVKVVSALKDQEFSGVVLIFNAFYKSANKDFFMQSTAAEKEIIKILYLDKRFSKTPDLSKKFTDFANALKNDNVSNFFKKFESQKS